MPEGILVCVKKVLRFWKLFRIAREKLKWTNLFFFKKKKKKISLEILIKFHSIWTCSSAQFITVKMLGGSYIPETFNSLIIPYDIAFPDILQLQTCFFSLEEIAVFSLFLFNQSLYLYNRWFFFSLLHFDQSMHLYNTVFIFSVSLQPISVSVTSTF